MKAHCMSPDLYSLSWDTICPFVKAPLPECYCVKMDSIKISSASYYCMGHPSACELFRLAVAGKS